MTLVWKEWRDLWPRCALAVTIMFLGLFAFRESQAVDQGLAELVRMFMAGDAVSTARGDHSSIVIALLIGMTLWSCALGYDTLARETADDTWVFLRTRPMRVPGFVLAKVAPRAALVLLPWLLYRGAVYAFLFLGQPGHAPTAFSVQEQLDAQYVLLRLPYTFLYGEAIVPVSALASLALAILVGSLTRHKGIALAGALLASALLAAMEWWLFMEAWYAAAIYWEAPRGAFAVVAGIALVLCTLACWRTASRSPLVRPAIGVLEVEGGRGMVIVWAVVFVVVLMFLTVQGGRGQPVG